MQTVRITTSQNIDIDHEVAGLGERILATLVDFAIFFLLSILCLVVNTMTTTGRSFFEVTFIILGVIYVFYDPVCEIFMNGQSVGKRVMKIKVISLDGGQANVGQYLMRWIFKIVDFTLTGSACAVVCAAVTEKSQRLGDLVAGTILIRTEPRTQIDALAFTPHVEDYTPVFSEVTQLSDKDMVLIHEVITSYLKSGNAVILYNTANKLKQVLNIQTTMDDLLFLQTLLRDYNHIAAAVDSV